MTKARARERAKANAMKKLKKRLAAAAAAAAEPDQDVHPGKFDAGTNSIKSPSQNVNANTFAGSKRGAARSK